MKTLLPFLVVIGWSFASHAVQAGWGKVESSGDQLFWDYYSRVLSRHYSPCPDWIRRYGDRSGQRSDDSIVGGTHSTQLGSVFESHTALKIQGPPPWCSVFAKQQAKSTAEEQRLQRFWHDYYRGLSEFYASQPEPDWVRHYGNRSGFSFSIRGGTNPTQSEMPYGPGHSVPNAYPGPYGYGPDPYPMPGGH